MYKLKDFQHPRDSKIAKEILSSSAAKSIFNKFHETGLEEAYTYLYRSSCPELTKETSSTLFELLAEACKMFELETVPKVYVTRDYREMISVFGINNPFLIFSSEYLRRFDEDKEMLFGILAGQVAAIRCEHHKILGIAWGIDFASGLIPFGSFATDPIINDWRRCRYFTYDRAFCLATKNRVLSLKQVLINVVPQNILTKMNIGGGKNKDVFLPQAENFLKTMQDDQTQALIKTAISMYSHKIWLPERYDEINNFFKERNL